MGIASRETKGVPRLQRENAEQAMNETPTMQGQDYTEQTLAVSCPECDAERSDLCAYRYRGVNKNRPKPHYARIVAARKETGSRGLALSPQQQGLLNYLRSKPTFTGSGEFVYWERCHHAAQARTAESLERLGLIDVSRIGSFRSDWEMRARRRK